MRFAKRSFRGISSSLSSSSVLHWLPCCRLSLCICILICCCRPSISFTADPTNNLSQQTPLKVLVTGASGQTGRLVLKKLEEDCRYEPKGLVRSENSAKSLMGDISIPLEHMIISDTTSPTFEEDLPDGLEGLDAMVICTSAVPRISRRSLVGAIIKAPFNLIRRKSVIDFRSLQFKWKYGGYPEIVDYHGVVKQIKLAQKLGMKQIIMVSSMGVTDPNHFLNNVGKDKNGGGNGDILVWKRKAERFLVESGLDYCIIHPGGLVDTPGGKQQVELDVDDSFFYSGNRTCIGREDVAGLCVSSLDLGRGKQVSFDCIAHEPSGGNVKSIDETLAGFLNECKTANYSTI